MKPEDALIDAVLNEHESPPSLTFAEFARVNRLRCESPDGFAHPLSLWSLSDWAVAMSGEAGEACNVVKKLNRHRDNLPEDKSYDDLMIQLSDEIGDTLSYLDLMCQAAGISLEKALARKFNRVSEKYDYRGPGL